MFAVNSLVVKACKNTSRTAREQNVFVAITGKAEHVSDLPVFASRQKTTQRQVFSASLSFPPGPLASPLILLLSFLLCSHHYGLALSLSLSSCRVSHSLHVCPEDTFTSYVSSCPLSQSLSMSLSLFSSYFCVSLFLFLWCCLPYWGVILFVLWQSVSVDARV